MFDALPIYAIVFYCFAGLLIASAVWVIVAKNPVQAVLSLVLCFFASSILWMMLQAEFLALVLIFVYVGAVMTLFLFVVMMLNIDIVSVREGFARYLLLGLVVMAILIGLMIFAIWPEHLAQLAVPLEGHQASNIQSLGVLLFTEYLYPFEIAGVILLVAIVASISLAFHGRKPDAKRQNIRAQHAVQPKDRVRIIKMKAEKHD